jgi:hypothetical protein
MIDHMGSRVRGPAEMGYYAAFVPDPRCNYIAAGVRD